VTAAADNTCSHDQCQTSGGSGGGSHDGGNPYVVYPAPQPTYAQQPAYAQQPMQQPAPYGASRPPAPPPSAAPAVAEAPPRPTAVPTPAPPIKPFVTTPAETDLRPSLLVLGALVVLAILVVSGFGARDRLIRGWNGGPSDPTAF